MEVVDGASLRTVRVRGGSQKVAMLFGEHSRELISPEAGLRLLNLLCDRVGTLQARLRAKKVLKKYSFLIFPNVNPVGRRLVEQGRYCHRTNGRNVDLNRNWNIGWHLVSAAETASGPSAFSEPETRIVRDVVTAFSPDVFMSVHSGALGMFTPFAYVKANDIPPSSPLASGDAEVTRRMRNGLSAATKALKSANSDFCRCGVGAAALELNYLCPGNCLDYAFEALRVPFSFAFEIWDGQTYAHPKAAALVEADEAATITTASNADASADADADVDEEGEEEFEMADMIDVASFFELDEGIHAHDHDHGHAHSHNDGVIHAHDNKAPRRGHSCLSSPESFAPTAELEGLVAHEISSEMSAEVGSPADDKKQRFVVPSPGAVQRCFEQFNPSGAGDYEKTVAHWAHAFVAILDRLPSTRSL